MSAAPWRNNSLLLGGERDPLLSDQGDTIIGVYLLLLGWLSWFGNSIVLFVLYRQRAGLQPSDYLTLNLALSDGSISVFGYSRGILQVFNGFQGSDYIITSIWTCQVDGFFTLISGLTSILTLTAISITRYIKGCHPSRAHHITRSSVYVTLLLIWITAAFWAGAPLLGWASYKDRGYGTCEIDWARASYAPAHRAYIISIFSCCFFLPVLVMLFCYVSIINTVKRGNALAGGELSDRQRRVERDVTIVSIVICTAFILAWSPYAVVSIWSAWGYQVPNLTSIFTRLFAKSASFYNPLIYFGLNSKFRKDVVVLLPCTPDAKDAVRLKRFRPRADARLRVQLNRHEKKYSPGNNPYPVPSPPATPPPANKEVFYKTTPHPLESNAPNKEVFYKTTPHPLETNAPNKEVFYINMPRPLESDADFECDRL